MSKYKVGDKFIVTVTDTVNLKNKIGYRVDNNLYLPEYCLNQFQRLTLNRPKGEWITEYNGNGWNDYWDYTCSNCGKKYERGDAVLYKANYCPNCGARMKGANDEINRC